MPDISKKNSLEDKNFDESKKEQVDRKQLDEDIIIDKQAQLVTKAEINKLRSDIESKKQVVAIEKNLDKAFDKSTTNLETNLETNSDTKVSGPNKASTNPHLKWRPITVQKTTEQIEQEVKNMIAVSDEDPNPIARLSGKIMKKIMTREH